MSQAPLFGLRWVPDSSLRPLRYLPNPSASPAGSEWWQAHTPLPRGTTTTAAENTSSPDRGESTPGGGDDREAMKLRQSNRSLTQRLGEAQESVRQKVEQIRWLKEMTRDDASRARVARWMRGPLLRIFMAWKRVVRDSVKRALDDVQAEFAAASQRHRELQARCDDLSREHAVVQVALEHYYTKAHRKRQNKQLEACFRRWAPLRLSMSGRFSGLSPLPGRGKPPVTPGSLRSPGGGGLVAKHRVAAARRALLNLHAHAQEVLLVDTLQRRTKRRHAHRGLRRGMDRLIGLLTSLQLTELSESQGADAVRMRGALRRLRHATDRRGHMYALEHVLCPSARRRALRLFWCRWTTEVVGVLGARYKLEESRAKKASEQLQEQLTLRQSAEDENGLLKMATSLWSDDELPAMLANLSAAAEDAEAAVDVEGPDAPSIRREAAVVAAGWQGTQLKLTLAVLDSLKRELARERAALASARSEAKASDAVAEQALTMLQQLREDSAALQNRLASLEELKLRTEQALVQRDAELFDLGRAQHHASRQVAVTLSAVEEKVFAQLQRIDAKLQVTDNKMQILDSRVKRGVEVASEKKMKDKLKTVMPGATPATTNTSASTGGLGISSSLDASFLSGMGLSGGPLMPPSGASP